MLLCGPSSSGRIPEAGEIIKRPELAQTLELISKKGAKEFYTGDLAKKIVTESQKAGGILTLEDLKSYKVRELKPICETYRGENTICSFPPPSSGGICIIEALNILENFDMKILVKGHQPLMKMLLTHLEKECNNESIRQSSSTD